MASTYSQSHDRNNTRDARRKSPRSIPHNGATCDNSMCDAPYIAADERLCPGPDGLRLCFRCYKRFKIERRRAKEAQRRVTDTWMKPKRSRSKSNTSVARARSPHAKVQFSDAKPTTIPFTSERIKRPSPVITSVSTFEKRSHLDDLPTIVSKKVGQYDSRMAPNRPSRRERSNPPHVYRDRAGVTSTYEEAEFYKFGRVEEEGEHKEQRRCCGGGHSKRRCLVIGLALISIIVLIIIIALAATLTRKRDRFQYVPSTAQVNNTMAFESGGATRDNVNETKLGIGAGTDAYTYYQGNASNFPSKEVSRKFF